MARPPRSLKRQAAYARGLEAETLAARHLVGLGFAIVETRYRSGSGEVDLIARDGETILFVEVKARASVTSALDSVSRASQRRIEAAGRGLDRGARGWASSVVAQRRHCHRAGLHAVPLRGRVVVVSAADSCGPADGPTVASQAMRLALTLP